MEEDSKWRSEEEEGEEEKGLMAFPLIAPLPTFIPTLHPCIQPPAPVWSQQETLVAEQGLVPSLGWAQGWGHSPQGLMTSRPTLAMP